MGCTSSKQSHRLAATSPYNRSASLPVRRIARRSYADDDHRHVVALTSSTLGSLRLESNEEIEEEMMKSRNDSSKREDDLAARAKEWSLMIGKRITPITPTITPPNEPETINTWELMAGLEEEEEEEPPLQTINLNRSFSFHADPKIISTAKPMWMSQVSDSESVVSDFDPEIISTFRKAMEELSPQHPVISSNNRNREEPNFIGIVKARITEFQEKIDAKKALHNNIVKFPPGGDGKVVIYFTSLRGVRKTYEDCSMVRVIMKEYRVKVDERDVSMHCGFKEELNEILGPNYGGNKLPRVFAKGKYLGGAEEVKQMHEAGELGSALEGCETVTLAKGIRVGPCEGCGDMRFVPCHTCSGSCKIYVEEEEEGGFMRCHTCNENGLVRCPICC